MKSECITEISVERHNSPWKNMTASAEEEKASGKILLVNDISSYEKLEYLSRYNINGKLLLAIDQKKKRVVANADYFAEIYKKSAIFFSSGEAQRVGALNKKISDEIVYRSLILFLIESEVIQTYIHLESHLCMMSESDSKTEYRAVFRGEHIYYTSKRNEGRLSFEVRVDKKSGIIQLIPVEI